FKKPASRKPRGLFCPCETGPGFKIPSSPEEQPSLPESVRVTNKTAPSQTRFNLNARSPLTNIGKRGDLFRPPRRADRVVRRLSTARSRLWSGGRVWRRGGECRR